MPQPLYSQEGDPLPIIQEAGWGRGVGLDGFGKSHPHRVQTLTASIT